MNKQETQEKEVERDRRDRRRFEEKTEEKERTEEEKKGSEKKVSKKEKVSHFPNYWEPSLDDKEEIESPEKKLREVSLTEFGRTSTEHGSKLDRGVRRRNRTDKDTSPKRSLHIEGRGISRMERSKKEVKGKMEIRENPVKRVDERAKVEETRPSKAEEKMEELPYFFEVIFSGMGDAIESNKPLVIFLDDPKCSYIGALRTLCLRIYREKVERKTPKEAPIIGDLEELLAEDRWIEADNRIFTIQLGEEDWKELLENKKKELKRVWRRLQQLFAQEFGFVILNKEIGKELPIPQQKVKSLTVRPRDVNLKKRRDFVRLCWGANEVLPGPDFNNEFNSNSWDGKDLIDRIEKVEKGQFIHATEQAENESDLHFGMKALMVKMCVDQLRSRGLHELSYLDEIKDEVKTEHKKEGVIADVYQRGTAYEIETFFSEDREGRRPRKKLQESIEKYEGKGFHQIKIVLDPLTFLRHLKMISDVREIYQKDKEMDVEYTTLNIEDESFLTYEDIVKKLSELM